MSKSPKIDPMIKIYYGSKDRYYRLNGTCIIRIEHHPYMHMCLKKTKITTLKKYLIKEL